jgi:hypothetical protein
MTTITVTIWHNVARDEQDRHIPLLDGYLPTAPTTPPSPSLARQASLAA